MNRRFRNLALLGWSITLASGVVLAGVGDVDPNYGTGGRVDFMGPFGALGDGSLVYAIAAPLAGSTDYARLDANGKPDTLFGVAGRLTLPVDGFAPAAGVTLRTPAGQLLLGVRQNGYASVLRLDGTGHPDSSFGVAGIVHLSPLTALCPNDFAEDLAFQPNGGLLTLISNYDTVYGDQVPLSIAIRRLTSTGSLDQGFANGAGVIAETLATCSNPSVGYEGFVTLNTLQGGAIAVGLPASDRYYSADGLGLPNLPVVAGLPTTVREWRFGGALPNGDQIYTNGLPFSQTRNVASAVVTVARIHPDGTADTSFGSAGTVFVALDLGALISNETNLVETVRTTRISADGAHIYLAILLTRQCGNSCNHGEVFGLVIVRLLSSGSLAGSMDVSFGNRGTVLLANSSVVDVTDMIEQPGGAVVVTSGDSAIRLLGDATRSPGVIGAVGNYLEVPVSDGTAQVRIARTLGKDGALSVNYATDDVPHDAGSAVPGTDYTPVHGQLIWADGDSADKVIAIPVFHNNSALDSKLLSVRLAATTGGAVIVNGIAQVFVDAAVALTPAPATPTVPATPAASGGGGSWDSWSVSILSLLLLHAITVRRRHQGSARDPEAGDWSANHGFQSMCRAAPACCAVGSASMGDG